MFEAVRSFPCIMQVGLSLPFDEVFEVIASKVISQLCPSLESVFDNFLNIG
jgi:hypothetical protein